MNINVNQIAQIVPKLNKDYILDKNKGLNNNERQLIVIVIYFE